MNNNSTFKKLGEISKICLGLTHTPNYVEKGIPFLSVKDITKGHISFEKTKYISEDEFEKAPDGAKPENGDILFGRVGTIGQPQIVTTEIQFCIFVSLGFLKITDENVINTYVRYWMLSQSFYRQVKENIQGIAIKNLNTGWLKNFTLPIPLLLAQQQIVSELDTLSDIISKKKQQIEELDKLAQATFYDMFGDPVTNEKGWKMIKSKDFCSKITDGTHDTPERLTEGVKFITGKHIRANIIDYENSDYVTLDVHKEIFRRCNPEHGDVLYTNIGVNLGTAAINKVYYEFSMKNVALLKMKSEILNGYYLQYYLNNQEVRNHILDEFASGGAQKFLSLASIKRISVPIPTITLQSEFANRIESIESQKVLINQSIGDVQQLFDYTMDKYFN